MHGPREVNLVLIVHGDANEQLCFPGCAPDVLPELIALQDKLVGIAGDGGVPHMCELNLISSG